MSNLWPKEVAAFRAEHLRSKEHQFILAIVDVEMQVAQRFGIDPTQDDVGDDAKTFAFLSLSRLFAETDAERTKLDAAIAACLSSRLSS